MRILMLDDRVPHEHLGVGYPRTKAILDLMSAMGHYVTFIPCVYKDTARTARRTLPPNCRYLPKDKSADIARVMVRERRRFDLLWVSRPHNLAMLQRFINPDNSLWKRYPLVVYDAEGIFSLQSERMWPYYPDAFRWQFNRELTLTRVADLVVAVSSHEAGFFERYGKPAMILRCKYRVTPVERKFEQRSGFLFVGPLADLPSPNTDALIWFCSEVVPLLRAEMGEEFALSVAGSVESDEVARLAAPDIELLGMVPDLSPLYRDSRVFIAPHRFASGIPLKIIEAAAYGLPVAATELLATQLEWGHRREIFAAPENSPEAYADICMQLYRQADDWYSVRERALSRISYDYSEEVFRSHLQDILESNRADQ